MGREINELLRQYYRSRSIRKRMGEFLGRHHGGKPTAAYIVANDGYSDFGSPAPPHLLPQFLNLGRDVARSVWDRESLIADLDLAYENFDSPAAAYLDPERTFVVMEPAFSSTVQVLRDFGIRSLDMVSGRGFHLVWRIPRKSEAFRRLAKIGRVPLSLMSRYPDADAPDGPGVDLKLANAFAGLGMVLEFAAHRVLRATASRSPVSIQVTSIDAGAQEHGREIISLDLSEYGDPLHLGHLRMPFSAYLEPRKLVWALGTDRVRELLPLFQIPLAGMALPEAVAVMRSPERTRRLAKSVCAEISDQSEATLALIEAYACSELAAFHERFYAMPETDAHRLVAEKTRSLTDTLPRCVQLVLDNPNDWLLKPAALQHIARVLTALNWHPMEIAALIRTRYDADYGWGDTWSRHDASWRAIFYSRLFTGLIATGTDQRIDTSCASYKEERCSTIPECCGNLRDTYLNRSAS